MRKTILLTISSLTAVLIISCMPYKNKMNGTWISGNYLDSAATVITISDSTIISYCSSIILDTAFFQLHDEYMTIDSGNVCANDYWWASENYIILHTLKNDTLRLSTCGYRDPIVFIRCDTLTYEQILIAAKKVSISLPNGIGKPADSLNCLFELYVGKPKPYEGEGKDSISPYALQLNDAIRSLDDIRDYIAYNPREHWAHAAILADKDTPMCYINHIQKELQRSSQPFAFAVISENQTISYIKTGWIYPDFFPIEAEEEEEISAMLALFEESKVILDTLGGCSFRGEKIPPNEVKNYFENYLNNETEVALLQLGYSPNTTCQQYLDFMGFIREYRNKRLLNDPDYDLLGIADFGYIGRKQDRWSIANN